ncbi:hypothetical protein HKD37_15G043730 [Glycine soja]
MKSTISSNEPTYLIAYNTPLNSFNFNGLAGGSDFEGNRIVGVDAKNAKLDDLANIPKFGALIHVLIEPFVTNGEMEFLDKESMAKKLNFRVTGKEFMVRMQGAMEGRKGKLTMMVEKGKNVMMWYFVYYVIT